MGDEAEWQSYVAGMRKPSTWGDELCLRAAAEFLNVKILVVTSEASNWMLEYAPEAGGHTVERTLFLTFISPIHYNTIDPQEAIDTSIGIELLRSSFAHTKSSSSSHLHSF